MLIVHPIADLLPAMTDNEYTELLESIRDNGLREPVTVTPRRSPYRWAASGGGLRRTRHAARDPAFRGRGLDDLVAFVLDMNLKRRHLSETQRAAVAAELPALRQGARTDLASIEAKSQPERAALLNVSRSAVQRAEIVRDRGIPELFQAIKQDQLPVSQAVALADMEPDWQRAALDRIVAGQRACHVVLSERRTERAQKSSTLQPRSRSASSAAASRSSTRTRPGASRPGLRRAEDGRPSSITPAWASKISAHSRSLRLPLTMRCCSCGRRRRCSRRRCGSLTHGASSIRRTRFGRRNSIGLGYWLRNQHEHIIIATRGNMPAPAHAVSSVFHGASGRHSEKPACVRDWIRDAYPDVGRIELFARHAEQGWAVWGHEAPEG